MQFLRSLLLIGLFGLASLATTAAIETVWRVDAPTCDGQAMQLTDVCSHTTNGSSASYSYYQQLASQRSDRHLYLFLGALVAVTLIAAPFMPQITKALGMKTARTP